MARCQVCDGPIVNGRCKLCGMPYKRDEVLYHLNESKSEHYKHASEKARAQMKQAHIPVSDRKKTEDKSEVGKALDERIRQRRQAAELGKMQKSVKTHSRLAVILTVVVLVLAIVPSAVGYIKEKYETGQAREVKKAVKGYIDTEELLLMGLMDSTQSEIEVGDTFDQGMVMAGEYVLEVPYGYMEILVQYAESGKNEVFYEFDDEENQIVLELHEGDRLFVNGYDDKNNYVMMFLIEQYDELTSM